jgi:hypothetical protein
MQRLLGISSVLLVTLSLPALQAQNQPMGVVEEHPAGDSSAGFTADYPTIRPGIFIQGEHWSIVANENPIRTKLAHGLAASLSYGVVAAKIVAEYEGEHASAEVETAKPILCICHLVSLPGAPVLVRLHPKKGARELDGGRMIVLPVVGGSKMADANKTDLIPIDVSQPDPQVWLVRPQFPLDPGEYALMLGTQNISIFPFTVAAPSGH